MKITNWIQLTLLLALIFLGVFAARYDKLKLKECSQEGFAVIIDKNKRKSRGYFIKYKYIVGERTYTTSESIKKKIEVDSFSVGDTIMIEYSCQNPNVSKFKKIE